MSRSAYLTDHFTTDDFLNFSDFRPGLQSILSHAQTPLTVGVFGAWGSGKTSLLRMLHDDIEKLGLASTRTVWFTAWKYDRHDALWRSFILRVLDALYPRETKPADLLRSQRPVLQNPNEQEQKLIELLERLEASVYQPVDWEEIGERAINWWQLISNSGQAGIEIAATMATAGVFPWLKQAIGGDGSPVDNIQAAASAFSRETKAYQRSQLLQLEQFEQTFEEAIKLLDPQDGRGRVVIFVDDLDRCLPEKAVEVLEAIKLFMDVPGVVFVLGMDKEVVERGIEARYRSFFHDKTVRGNELPINGNAYLQKMIQIPFHLPPLPYAEVAGYIRNLEGENLRLSEVTREVFARGLFPNPRQVKRAINIFQLLKQIAQAREGRGGLPQNSIAWPLLAKTVVIQTQFPQLYSDWRRYPTLLQTLEQEFRSRPTVEEEMVRGRGRVEGEGVGEVARPGGVMAPYLEERQKYALLEAMLTYPEATAIGEGRQRALFAELSREQLSAYVHLAGTVDAEPDALIEIAEDLLTELLSLDTARIREGVAQLQGEEDEAEQERARQKMLQIMGDGQQPARTRASAGETLSYLGDPREEVMTVDGMQFCYVPPGDFWMGEGEQHHLNTYLDYGYWLGQHPISVSQIAEYVRDTNVEIPDSEWQNDLRSRPVRSLSWLEALAFCEWLTKRWQGKLPENWRIVLPSEAEWEKAVRGGMQVPSKAVVSNEIVDKPNVDLQTNLEPSRNQPWGWGWNNEKANYKATRIGNVTVAGCFLDGVSVYGCYDLVGNTWEWTRSLWGDKWAWPYVPSDGRENLHAGRSVGRVLRGGSFDSSAVGTGSRRGVGSFGRDRDIGLRVAAVPFLTL